MTHHGSMKMLISVIAAVLLVYVVAEGILGSYLAGWPDLFRMLAEAIGLIVVVYPMLHFLAYRPLAREITEHQRSEKALRESEERYRTLAEAAQDVIFVIGNDDRVQYVNSYGAKQLGFRAEEVVGKRREELFPPEVSDRQRRSLRQVYETGKPHYSENVTTYGSREVWLGTWLVPIVAADGSKQSVLGISRDVSDRKALEEQLRQLAMHDPLTGLANRRSLQEVLNRAVARARREGTSALLFMDVDNFKVVNDTVGHSAGDELLVRVVKLLQGQLRSSDLLARVGGDEFGALLDGMHVRDGCLAGERLCATVRETKWELNGVVFHLGLSIGLALIDGDEDADGLLCRADQAMYRAKARGGNAVVVFEPSADPRRSSPMTQF